MPVCKQCGAEVSNTAKFCEQCGTKLKPGELKPTQDKKNSTAAETPKTDKPDQATGSEGAGKGEDADAEELDLTALDKKVREGKTPDSEAQAPPQTKQPKQETPKKADNIINLNEILESEEKKELDSSIKREVLADDEVFSKICPMCGEELQINKQLLRSTPVLVKCLKCGNETKIW